MREWSGVQRLPRPVQQCGLIVDTFYRRCLDLWVVWAFLPPDDSGFHHKIIQLGGFRDRARARFAADTAFVAATQGSAIVPMLSDLLADTDGDYLSVLHGISHVADVAPWICAHMQSRTEILRRIGKEDLERLIDQIEAYPETVQDWRLMWLSANGIPCPAMVRIKDKKAAAALVLAKSTFETNKVKFWIEGKEHEISCQPLDIAPNPLSGPVLDNIVKVMQYCDEKLTKRYGVDSNANELIALLREEGSRAAVREVAEVFGTSNFVGEA